MASDGPVQVPADGVCDFILYDSLKSPFDRLGQAATGTFKAFQGFAVKGNVTQFGVSISPLDVFAFLTLLNAPTATAWVTEKLWSHFIYHWGVMSIRETIMTKPGYFGNATALLAKAAEISKPTPKRPWVSYTFLGYYAGTKIGCDQAVRHINTHYTPSVLIILGHISFKEQEIQAEVSNYACLMIPPNINELPAHVKNKLVYGHTGVKFCLLVF
ncbi:uncharacterized protein LOC142767907 [Rhipicephalus microplus]|uniref:uncharacterized protein LOC142767907 n=1 Tax=Rhipicephalus microplus TaxID=6941 RepID=UPI003F6C9F18